MLVLLIAAWVAVGVVSVVVLRRRGHDTFAWAVVFLVLGPLAIPLAVSAERHLPPEPDGPRREGRLDLLVAHDGSTAAAAALDAALTMLGDEITSITLAAVVDVEATTTVRGRTTIEDARRRLDDVARGLVRSTRVPVDTLVLHGEPASVLQQYALDHGYEVIVVGGGSVRSPSPGLGRVARRVSSGSSVPVLVGPSVA